MGWIHTFVTQYLNNTRVNSIKNVFILWRTQVFVNTTVFVSCGHLLRLYQWISKRRQTNVCFPSKHNYLLIHRKLSCAVFLIHLSNIYVWKITWKASWKNSNAHSNQTPTQQNTLTRTSPETYSCLSLKKIEDGKATNFTYFKSRKIYEFFV